MSYLGLHGPPPFPIFQSFESPWQGAPGPVPPPPSGTVPGPTMPAQLFPTSNLKWGDVVNVTGPFQGLMPGQVRVKFTGATWQAPMMQGPFSASVRVPEGAETGKCPIEINGQRAFGTQCVISPRTGSYGQRVVPKSGPYGEGWKNIGDKSRMSLSGVGNAKLPRSALDALVIEAAAQAPKVPVGAFRELHPDDCDYVERKLVERGLNKEAVAEARATVCPITKKKPSQLGTIVFLGLIVGAAWLAGR